MTVRQCGLQVSPRATGNSRVGPTVAHGHLGPAVPAGGGRPELQQQGPELQQLKLQQFCEMGTSQKIPSIHHNYLAKKFNYYIIFHISTANVACEKDNPVNPVKYVAVQPIQLGCTFTIGLHNSMNHIIENDWIQTLKNDWNLNMNANHPISGIWGKVIWWRKKWMWWEKNNTSSQGCITPASLI